MFKFNYMNWKKTITITIVLGLILQFIGTLVLSYTLKGESSWTPFQVERCRASSCPAGSKNCQVESTCEKLTIVGALPYWYGGNKAYAPIGGFSIEGLLQNLILWHGLAFIIALLFSRKRKMIQA
jgi:hypothetical protein